MVAHADFGVLSEVSSAFVGCCPNHPAGDCPSALAHHPASGDASVRVSAASTVCRGETPRMRAGLAQANPAAGACSVIASYAART